MMPEILCPSCSHDLEGRTEGDCPRCGYAPDWKVLLAKAGLPRTDVNLHCPGCGYDLRGSPEGDCPECGRFLDREAIREQAAMPPWAYVRGIIVLTVGPFVPVLLAYLFPKGEFIGTVCVLWMIVAFVTIGVAAVSDSRRIGLRRVVLQGRSPSPGFESLIALAVFASLLLYAFLITSIAFAMVLHAVSPHWR